MFKHLILVLAILQVSPQYCQSFSYQNSFYDINLGSTSDRQLTITSNTTTGSNLTISYNLCRNVADVCEVITPDATSTTFTVTDYQGRAVLQLNDNYCIPFPDYPTLSLVNTSDPNSGLVLTFQSIPLPTTSSTPVILTIINPCSPYTLPANTDTHYYVFSGVSGCTKVDLTTLWDFFSAHTLAFFITTQVLGVILMTLGIYLYRVTLLVLGTLAAFFILAMVESLVVFQPGVSNALISSVITITIITSVLAGYVTLYFPKAGLFVMGMWDGFFLSFILNNIALYHIPANPPALPLMITMAILGVGMGIMSLFIKKTFVIVSTSFIGAYASIRALSWYLGKYPNEFLIGKQFHTNQSQQGVEWQYYVYVVALVILTCSSMAVQFWLFRKKSKMLGKKADLDQYIGKIEEEQDLERSKFIKLDNIFKKQEKKPKARFLKKKVSDDQEQSQEEQPKKVQGKNQRRSSGKHAAKKRKVSSDEEQNSPPEQEQDEDEEEGSSRRSGSKGSKRQSEDDSLQEKLLKNKRKK